MIHPENSLPLNDLPADRIMRRLQGAGSAASRGTLPWESLLFNAEDLTLHCAERTRAGDGAVPLAEWSSLVGSHGANVDACSPAALIAGFECPAAALAVALALQRSERVPDQMALTTGTCLAARLTWSGQAWGVLIGRQVQQVERLARRTPAGTVQMAPETLLWLESHFADGLCDGRVAASFADEDLLEASITLPPGMFSEARTFAGLGLV